MLVRTLHNRSFPKLDYEHDLFSSREFEECFPSLFSGVVIV